MTREQALAIIKRESDLYPEDSVDSVEWLEVYKALEQPIDEIIKYLECNNIDVQEFIKVMKKQPLQVQPNSMQLVFEMMNRSTCDDCVSRAEAINAITDTESYNETFAEAKMRIAELSPVTPTRKVGKWKKNEHTFWTCSECGLVNKYNRVQYTYCPNCGAEMRGNENGSN